MASAQPPASADAMPPSRSAQLSDRVWQLSRQETWRLIGGSLLFALVFLYPILCDSSPDATDWILRPDLSHLSAIPADGDRNMFAELRWVPYYTLAHFHQMPYWNPYKCGGMSMLGNPEAAIVTPFIVFYLLFGLTPGILLEIYLHLALMFAGDYVLGRELCLRPLACVVLAAMFPSSSWLPLHIAAGHLNFLSVAYVPWILVMLLASCRTTGPSGFAPRWYPAIFGGLLCALTLTEGNYAFVFAAMLAAPIAVYLAIRRRSLRPVIAAATIGAFSLALAALKLVPTIEQLSLYPRDWGLNYLTWPGVLASIFSRNQDYLRPLTGPFFFSEYGGYLGAPFIALALIGIVCGGRAAIVWTLGVAGFLMLYRGDTSPHAPTMLLHYLPLGGNIGLCGRWVIPLVLCVAVLAALGAQFLLERSNKWGARLAVALLGVGLLDAWIVCAPNYRYLFPPAPAAFPAAPTFRQFWFEPANVMTEINQANMGAANCAGYGYTVPVGVTGGSFVRGKVRGYNEPDYRGEFFLLGAGAASRTEWTPNRMSYEVNAPAATSLIINQNMFPGWRVANGDGEIYSEGGLIAVHVPAGRHRIELAFRPRHIAWAFAATILATMLLLAAWLKRI